MLISELHLYDNRSSFRIHSRGKKIRNKSRRLEKINKYDTLAFIIETWKIGLAIYMYKEDRKEKTSRIANAESGPLNSFVFSVVCAFNGHLSFMFDFFFQ